VAEPDPRRGPARRIVDPLTDFLRDEAAGGLALLLATGCALAWANAAPDGYASLWSRVLDLGVLELDLRHWINDGLMAVFFFVVGLEIKRELVAGELRDRRAAALPVLAALGGIALPAIVFLAGVAAGAWRSRAAWAGSTCGSGAAASGVGRPSASGAVSRARVAGAWPWCPWRRVCDGAVGVCGFGAPARW